VNVRIITFLKMFFIECRKAEVPVSRRSQSITKGIASGSVFPYVEKLKYKK
jgi:hypothetical protein